MKKLCKNKSPLCGQGGESDAKKSNSRIADNGYKFSCGC